MLYVYAITDAPKEKLDLPDAGILPEVRVVGLSSSGLTAIVSNVPSAVFGEVPLRAWLEDANWTRQRVLAHERVVAALMPQGTVLPLKFGTLFSLCDPLIAVMTHHRTMLEETLAHLRGAREWGVKIFCDPERLRHWVKERQPPEAETAAQGSGAAFFARKQREQRLSRQVENMICSCVDDSHGRLAHLVRTAVAGSPQSAALHGRQEDMVLNGAYLTAENEEAGLRDCLHNLREDYGDRGFDFVLTGPWAPYNFTRMHLGEHPQPIHAQ